MNVQSNTAAVRICQRDGTPVADACATQGKWLRWLYDTPAGRVCLKGLTAPVCSYLVGCAMDHPLSTLAIPVFVRSHGIALSDYEDTVYRSFNAFFTRRIRAGLRPIATAPETLISPCDAKLTVSPISADATFTIKGAPYRLAELVGCKRLAKRFLGGDCLIFRLTPDDYHRYCYPDACRAGAVREIPGRLHTVHPIAAACAEVYHRNTRTVTMLQTDHFGTLLQMEVGAMLVGRIVNHRQPCRPQKGTEKGYFAYGGSTVILVTEPNRVTIDPQLRRNSAAGYETLVRYGSAIGTAHLA